MKVRVTSITNDGGWKEQIKDDYELERDHYHIYHNTLAVHSLRSCVFIGRDGSMFMFTKLDEE